MLIVAGTRLRREQVLALASMLAGDGSDRTARVLLEALTSGQAFAALTVDDKECMLAALDQAPTVLTDLRGMLFNELNWQRRGLTPPARSPGIGAATARANAERGRIAWI
jgi:hypothetical protein